MTSSQGTDTGKRLREVDAEFLGDLKTEVASWRASRIISGDQARQILGLYAASPDASVAKGRLITALSILGSLLVGVGVILFIASNWDGMATEAKIAILLAVTLSAYGAGYWLKYVQGYDRLGHAVILLGTLLYGAAIHLVAQAYHFPVNDPDLMLLWFLGVVPLAYAARSRAITVLSLVLFLFALGFRMQDWLSNEFDAEVAFISAFAIFGVAGLMLNGLGRLQALWERTRLYSDVFQVIGLVTALAAIYLLGFRILHDLDRVVGNAGSLDHISTPYWVAISVAGTLALAGSVPAVLQIARSGARDAATALGAVGPLALLVPLVVVVALPGGGDVTYPLIFNLVLLGAIVGLLATGYVTGRESFVNVGLVFFSIDVISRYFEFGWDLIDRSLLFIINGTILLIGGYLLERGRRCVILRMRGERNSA